jgi:hypothetical protein
MLPKNVVKSKALHARSSARKELVPLVPEISKTLYSEVVAVYLAHVPHVTAKN